MHLTLIFSLRRRRGVPLDLFYAYWINAHAAQIAARLPGIHDLWLHEISYEDGLLWPRVADVEFELDEADRFEGVPEPAFANESDVNAFLANMGPLMEDEANIFDETVAYASIGQNSRTLVDHAPPTLCQKGGRRFMLFMRPRSGVSKQDFNAYVSNSFAATLAQASGVEKVRIHLFEPSPGDDSPMAKASAVSRAAPAVRDYGAMCEVAFADGMTFGAFARSDTWLNMQDGYRRHLSACHAFGVNVTHRLKQAGDMTFAGLRTPLIADIIDRVAAASQLDPDVDALQR